MIRYDLLCERAHAFDGWFRSSAAFDAQVGEGMLACPVCGSGAVRKALMAPALGSGKAGVEPAETPAQPAVPAEPSREMALVSDKEREVRAMLRAVRDHVRRTSENVGDAFPDLARKMHTEEIEHRSIYGRATPDEAKALAEEGVAVQALPVFPDDVN